ncbi:MAG TPA: hypothetical protein VIH57_02545, partial [Bacteroidales bacterium]
MKKRALNISLVLAFVFFGCSKEEVSINDQLNSPKILKSTAAISAGTVQQTIQGFGGASILAWEADLTSDQRTKA